MAYYEDLDRRIVEYHFSYLGIKSKKFLAIGWLEPMHAYNQGIVPEKFDQALKHLYHYSWKPAVFLGLYSCHFCSPGTNILYSGSDIFVPFKGKIYVAPNMLHHYISHHKYRPPDAFIRAVFHAARIGRILYYISIAINGAFQIMAKKIEYLGKSDRREREKKPSQAKTGIKHHHSDCRSNASS